MDKSIENETVEEREARYADLTARLGDGPQGKPFEWALGELKAGRAVRREIDRYKGEYVEMIGSMDGPSAPMSENAVTVMLVECDVHGKVIKGFSPVSTELLAVDWERAAKALKALPTEEA